MSAWLTIRETDRIEAHLLKGFLEAGGIPVRLQGESLGEFYGLSHGPLGLLRLQVPAELAAEAERALAARGEGDGEDGATEGQPAQ